MVQLQEITDDVATKLKLGDGKGDAAPATASVAAPAAAPAAATTQTPEPSQAPSPPPTPEKPVVGPELPPALAMTSGKSAEDILADLNKSPLFMTDLEENDDVAALQALAYEGTALENASDFKERGNECFRERGWTDAREFYGKGIAILVAEDRRRARGEAAPEKTDVDGNPQPDPDAPDQVAQQHAVLASLYANRAACQLELRNYRSCTQDCGASLRLQPHNVKAWFRSAKAMLALDKTAEAAEACGGGLAYDPQNKPLQKLLADVQKRAETVAALQRREQDRLDREKRKAARLRAVLRARGVRTRATAQPPEMEDAAIRLADPADDGSWDLDVSKSVLCYPTVFLYPLALQSDFVKAFRETDCTGDHLAYLLPVPWDESGKDYVSSAAVECYMETLAGGLVKVGKKVPLGKVLAQASVEVVDEVVRLFVVPKAQAAGWIAEFKAKKAAERGEH